MKHYSTLKKSIAVVLSAVFICLFFTSLFLIIEAVDAGCYDYRREFCVSEAYKEPIRRNLQQVVQTYYANGRSLRDAAALYQNTNFEFEHIRDGEVIFSTCSGLAILQSNRYYLQYADGTYPGEYLIGYAVLPVNRDDIFHKDVMFVAFLYDMRYALIAFLCLAAVLFVPLFTYLLVSACKHPREEKARGTFIELIPFDLFTAIYAGLTVLAVGGFTFIVGDLYDYFSRITYIFVTALTVLCYLLILLYLMSLITRLRIGGILKTTILWRLFAFLFRVLKIVFRAIWKVLCIIGRGFGKIGKSIGSFFRTLSLLKQAAITVVALSVLDFIFFLCSVGCELPLLFVFYLIARLILLILLARYVHTMLKKLKKGGKAIAEGNLAYQIETEHMIGDFKIIGEDLNHISAAMEKAVDARTKSERMRAELITNVSHDIKTPLTSIINYVDLLGKEEPESETVREYVSVLDRQAHKLKKLIGDLVEASKASTGNIAVHLSECDVCVMLEQTVGEYEEKLKKAGLSAIVNASKTPIRIIADGRHLWRVFDNLMSNICKYSLPGTRVFLETRCEGNMSIITFKNISRTPIDIPAEELTERFVRADTSRNTEGSGLGLSIAQSLVKLQNGTLDIVCDGDLFKVVLTFPTI